MKTVVIFFFNVFCITYLAGCNIPDPSDYKVPDFKPDPKTEDLFKTLYTCDKKDSELSLDQFVPDSTVTVKDKVDTMDIVDIDCDGHHKTKRHAPIRTIHQFITLEAPENVKEKINFVIIDNARTCSTQRINSTDDKFLDEQIIEVPNQEPIKVAGPTLSTLGFSGKLKILLSDSLLNFSGLHLNVHDGNNTIKVRYYGKCLKYKPEVDEEKGDAFNCLDAELIGEKRILVSLQVERPNVDGVHLNNTCVKSKTSNINSTITKTNTPNEGIIY